jgi:hypothetical protein
MSPAFEGVVFNETLGERDVAMGAGISESVNDPSRVNHHRNGLTIDNNFAGFAR